MPPTKPSRPKETTSDRWPSFQRSTSEPAFRPDLHRISPSPSPQAHLTPCGDFSFPPQHTEKKAPQPLSKTSACFQKKHCMFSRKPLHVFRKTSACFSEKLCMFSEKPRHVSKSSPRGNTQKPCIQHRKEPQTRPAFPSYFFTNHPHPLPFHADENKIVLKPIFPIVL